jgi:hypothetical protein
MVAEVVSAIQILVPPNKWLHPVSEAGAQKE